MSFRDDWLRDRPWLYYDDEKRAVYCTQCQLANGPRTLFNTTGYIGGSRKKLTLDCIVDHGRSKAHETSVAALARASALQLGFRRAAAAELDRMEPVTSNAPDTTFKHWHPYAMLCGYFLAKNSLPYALMGELSFLVQQSIKLFAGPTSFDKATGDYATYSTAEKATEIVASCSKLILNETIAMVKAAKFFSLMVDEATDVGSCKNLAVMVRFVLNGCIHVRVLAIAELAAGTGAAIASAIIALIELHEPDVEGFVGFASDGASVMTGCRQGVATRLKKKYPWLLCSHCPAHRLSLASEDAESEFEEERFGILTAVYTYFDKSHPRQQLLSDAIEELELRNLKPILGAFTRWLSRGNMLSNMHEIYDAVALVLANDDTSVLAKKYCAYYTTLGFKYWVAYMCDIIAMLNALSKQLQSSTLHITTVATVVEGTDRQLTDAFVARSLADVPPTPSLRRFFGTIANVEDVLTSDSCVKAHASCVSYVQRLIGCIIVRFPTDTSEVFTAFSVLYPSALILAKNLTEFGIVEVEKLGQLYLKDASSDELVFEYGSYKHFVLANYPTVDANDFLFLAAQNTHITINFPNVFTLVKIAATLAHGSVDCERVFSLQSNIKTKQRASLSTGHLQDLVVCARDGPLLKDFDTTTNMTQWRNSKKRKAA
jgi:hypothetical protein